MRIVVSLAAIAFSLWFTLPASTQAGACLVGPGPDGRPMSFQQWYGVCRVQLNQMCQTMRAISPVTNCNLIVRTSYQQYLNSFAFADGQNREFCEQFPGNAGCRYP